MLVLFDIDGTLLTSRGAGMEGMKQALRHLHGVEVSFDGVEIAGRLDPLIWRDLARTYDLPGDEAAHATFRATYASCLAELFARQNTARPLPGTLALVEALRNIPGLTLGLLTGNYEPTGMLKVHHAGFDRAGFVVNAWADDGPDRRSLVPVAMERYRARHGQAIAPERVVILGDTPHDVDCAKAHGTRVLGVATGQFSVEQLQRAGADHALPDLADVDAVAAWILKS